MKSKFENSERMMLATNEVLTEYEGEWTNIAKFADAVNELRSIIGSVRDERQVQERNLTGYTSDKNASKMEMCKLASVVAAIVSAYAGATGDTALKKLVSYNNSNLRYTRDTIALDRCTLIYNTALPLAGNLGDYGIENDMLPGLDAAITAFRGKISVPRSLTTRRKVAGVNIVEHIRKAEELLRTQLDKMMMRFKVTNPDFYLRYRNARMIIDLGRRKQKADVVVYGLITRSKGGGPLAGVKVFMAGGSGETLSKADGSYRLELDKTGDLRLKAELNGYPAAEKELQAEKNHEYEVNFEIEAGGNG